MLYILLLISLAAVTASGFVLYSDIKAEKTEYSDVTAIRKRLNDAQGELLDVRFAIKNFTRIASAEGLCPNIYHFRCDKQPSGFTIGGDVYVVQSTYTIRVYDMDGVDCGFFKPESVTLKKTWRSASGTLEAKLHTLRAREAELNNFIAFLENSLEAATAKQ